MRPEKAACSNLKKEKGKKPLKQSKCHEQLCVPLVLLLAFIIILLTALTIQHPGTSDIIDSRRLRYVHRSGVGNALRCPDCGDGMSDPRHLDFQIRHS